jgi:hypothetical protein
MCVLYLGARPSVHKKKEWKADYLLFFLLPWNGVKRHLPQPPSSFHVLEVFGFLLEMLLFFSLLAMLRLECIFTYFPM